MPTDPTPDHVTKEPTLPEGIELTEKQKAAQFIVSKVLGMVQSQWNVVMFKNSPSVWLQYFAGLTMQMPTIIILRKADAEWIASLKHPLVKAHFQVSDFKEPEASHVADKVAHFIKQHPQK